MAMQHVGAINLHWATWIK